LVPTKKIDGDGQKRLHEKKVKNILMFEGVFDRKWFWNAELKF